MIKVYDSSVHDSGATKHVANKCANLEIQDARLRISGCQDMNGFGQYHSQQCLSSESLPSILSHIRQANK